MLTYLLDRLTDRKIEHKTKECYTGFYNVQQLDAVYLTLFLFKQHSFINKNNVKSLPHLAARLKIVYHLLSSDAGQRLTVDIFPHEVVHKAIKMCINSSNGEMRKLTQDLTVVLYKHYGYSRVEHLMSTFNLKTLEVLCKEVPEVKATVERMKQ